MNIIYYKVDGSIKDCITIEGYYITEKRHFVCRIEKLKDHNVFTPEFRDSTIILKNDDDFYSIDTDLYFCSSVPPGKQITFEHDEHNIPVTIYMAMIGMIVTVL